MLRKVSIEGANGAFSIVQLEPGVWVARISLSDDECIFFVKARLGYDDYAKLSTILVPDDPDGPWMAIAGKVSVELHGQEAYDTVCGETNLRFAADVAEALTHLRGMKGGWT